MPATEPDRATVREALRKAFPDPPWECARCFCKLRVPLLHESFALCTGCAALVAEEQPGAEFTTAQPRYGEADKVEREMRWDCVMGCWLIERWGMTIGIEVNGYVHS